LPCHGAELHLVEDDKRLSFEETDRMAQLELEEKVVQVRHVLEELPDVVRCLGEVDEDIATVLILCELLNNG
jgi:hypothetical protein